MADKGIIFSAPMVRALRDGRKTQTRRLLKPQPADGAPHFTTGRGMHIWDWPGLGIGSDDGRELPKIHYAPGDRLYVREAWNTFVLSQDLEESWPTKEIPKSDPRLEDCHRHHVVLDYATDGLPGTDAGKGPWRPSIHMPRWASRLWLSVTDVRVQRVQEISEADAIAEGVEQHPAAPDHLWKAYEQDSNPVATARESFRGLWDSLHTKPGERWEDNPWIVAISFTVHHGNIDSTRSETA